MEVKELVTKWGFEIEEEKLEKLQHTIEGIKKGVELLAAIEIIKAVGELTEKFAKMAEELHVASSAAGLTVEAFQKLSFAAGQNGVSQDEMSTSMARLSRRLFEAKTGSAEAQKAFGLAGFNGNQIQSFKTGQDAMLALADRFKQMQDPIKKAALAQELMGRGSIRMVGFLSKGSGAITGLGERAEKLGIIMSEHQVDALVRVSHAFEELWGIIKSISVTIAAAFAPEITYVIGLFEKWWMANQKVIKAGLREWIYKVSYALGFIFGLIEGLIQQVTKWAESHKKLLTFLAIAAAWIAAAFLLRGVVGKVTNAFEILRYTSALAGGPLKMIKGFVTEIGKKMSFLKSETVAAFAPYLIATAAIVGIVAAIHDLYMIIFKGADLKDTWIGQFLDMLNVLDTVENAVDRLIQLFADLFTGNIAGLMKHFGEDMQDVGNSVAGFFGFKGLGKSEGGGMDVLHQIKNPTEGMNKAPAPSTAAMAAANNKNSYQVNAPIQVNVPPGTHPKDVGKHVQAGVKEHLDRVYRETNRSLKPTMAY